MLASGHPGLEIKILYGDFPGGPVVKNPPSNAGETGSSPGRGTKIPHAAGQLSLCTATTEPAHSGACAPQLEKPAHCNEEPVYRNEDPAQPKKEKRYCTTILYTVLYSKVHKSTTTCRGCTHITMYA